MEEIKNEIKFCKKCGHNKPINEFYTKKIYCKSCHYIMCKKSEAKKPEQYKNYRKKWASDNREKCNRRCKRWKTKNEEKLRIQRNTPQRIEKRREYHKNYYQNPEVKEHKKLQKREYRRKNPAFRIYCSLSARVRGLLKGSIKFGKTKDLLGCSYEEFRNYLERQFLSGMNWENYGQGNDKWNLGHKIHCALFDLTLEEHQQKCFHFSNYKPQWQLDNFRTNDLLSNGRRARDTPRIFRSEQSLIEISDELNWIS